MKQGIEIAAESVYMDDSGAFYTTFRARPVGMHLLPKLARQRPKRDDFDTTLCTDVAI